MRGTSARAGPPHRRTIGSAVTVRCPACQGFSAPVDTTQRCRAHPLTLKPSSGRHQRSVLEAMVALADLVVVMSDAASQRLCDGFDIDRHNVVTIPPGATLPTKLPLKRSGRPTLLTWGLLGPGKGVERVADA